MISKTIHVDSIDEARERIDEFLAGLDRVPDLLLFGEKLYDLMVEPKTFRRIKVRVDRTQDWMVKPMRKLMPFNGHMQMKETP